MVNQHAHKGRNLRGIPQALWEAFTAVVGPGGRSAAIREFIQWRVDNPHAELPPPAHGNSTTST